MKKYVVMILFFVLQSVGMHERARLLPEQTDGLSVPVMYYGTHVQQHQPHQLATSRGISWGTQTELPQRHATRGVCDVATDVVCCYTGSVGLPCCIGGTMMILFVIALKGTVY